jgi:16S rRNA (uracil1498-N3)-methyltransferase
MTLRRLHLPPDRLGEGRAELTPEARHYLEHVLRLAPGAELEVFDGRGAVFPARVDPAFTTLSLGPRRETPRRGAPIWLLFALAKGEKADLVVQKATELGAERLVPFAADRSVVRLAPDKGEERAGRWRRIAEEAARQSGRADVPDVAAPRGLEAALAELPPAFTPLVFHPGGVSLAALDAPAAGGLAAVVGPEGGLTDEELRACERAGARRMSLGPRVLRAETAAIVAVALLQERFGDMGDTPLP